MPWTRRPGTRAPAPPRRPWSPSGRRRPVGAGTPGPDLRGRADRVLSGVRKASSVGRDGGAVGALPRAKELVVYARTTTMQADRARIDAGVEYVRDQVFPAVTAMDGCVGMSLLADRGSGRCIATTAWESEAALRDSAERVRPLREGTEQALGSSGSDVEGWEIAVVHRDHATPDGACARVTWLDGSASN